MQFLGNKKFSMCAASGFVPFGPSETLTYIRLERKRCFKAVRAELPVGQPRTLQYFIFSLCSKHEFQEGSGKVGRNAFYEYERGTRRVSWLFMNDARRKLVSPGSFLSELKGLLLMPGVASVEKEDCHFHG